MKQVDVLLWMYRTSASALFDAVVKIIMLSSKEESVINGTVKVEV